MPPSSSRKWALLTGCSPGGLGEATTSALLSRGVNCIATDISFPSSSSSSSHSTTHTAPEDPSHGFLINLPLDVTSSTSIKRALETISHLTDGVLHFLFNNAGYGYYCPLLDADVEAAKREYDVNVWGLLAVTQAFFPLLRKGRGVVVNQASITGVQGFNMPFMGIYSSSKAAVICLSDAMRVEFAPLGVRVVVLITSAVKTEFFKHRIGGFIDEGSIYAPVKAAADGKLGGSFAGGGGYDRFSVAEKTVEEVVRETPRRYIREGYRATYLSWVYWLCPTWLMDSLNVKGFDLHLLDGDSGKVEQAGGKQD